LRQIDAMVATLKFARENEYDLISFEEEGVDYEHLESMLKRVQEAHPPLGEAKLGRWLGWMQGVLVANQCGTLENYKAINKSFSDDFTHRHLGRGTKYKVVGMARAQCSVEPIKDGDMLMLYVGEDGVYSVRPPAEFNDGRFERMLPPESPIAEKIE
jgi:hypothetical protein